MRLPVVEANFAVSVDGKTARKPGRAVDFTSRRDRRKMLELRAAADAVMIGRSTLETDDVPMRLPAADLRRARVRCGKTPEPLRVIISARGRIKKTLRIFRCPGPPLIVFTTPAMPARTRAWLGEFAEVRVQKKRGPINLRSVLRILARDCGVRRVVCEGGPTLLRALLAEGLVTRLHVTLTPFIFGGAAAPSLLGVAAAARLPRSVPLHLEALESEGEEAFATYRLGPRGRRPLQ